MVTRTRQIGGEGSPYKLSLPDNSQKQEELGKKIEEAGDK